ncbi:MAG TPA: cytochrome c [Pirellulales bacterium]|nr:cytochrome c [Pirellulales bacterium]
MRSWGLRPRLRSVAAPRLCHGAAPQHDSEISTNSAVAAQSSRHTPCAVAAQHDGHAPAIIAAQRGRRASCAVAGAWLAALLAAPGCSPHYGKPEFRVNLQDILQETQKTTDDFRITGSEADADEKTEKETNRDKLQFVATALVAAFGTPDKPYLFSEVGLPSDDPRWRGLEPDERKKRLDMKKIELAAGSPGGDQDGKQRGLFRQHCAHCHGVTGDGAGPTAAFLNPYPRDYRQGVFKFKSTERNAKPTAADLKRTLVDGIPGTAMPSFMLLPNDEIDALVEYVRYLSIRGQFERDLAIGLLAQDEDIPKTGAELLETYLTPIVERWAEAEAKIVRPEAPPSGALSESIAKGRELFFGKKAGCAKCHGPMALGDANDGAVEKDRLFDDWNKNKNAENISFWLLPKMELKPRNLRLGIYRGGRRPLDLFRRIHAGIPGGPMPAVGTEQGGQKGSLDPEQIWHIVDYVRSLPYEPMSLPHAGRATALLKERN